MLDMRLNRRVLFAHRSWLIGLATLAVAVLGLAARATLGGAAPQEHGVVPVSSADQAKSASSVSEVIAQVQTSFGDGLIRTAAVQGATLKVDLAPNDEPSALTAEFESAVLAHAVADWQRNNGQTPITEFSSIGVDGQPISGMATEVIGSDAVGDSLAPGTCEGAAQQTPASLVIVSASTLPYAGGTCIITVETSGDPNLAAQDVGRALSGAIQAPNAYPSLIEVDDLSGTPQLMLSWLPGSGVGNGEGSTYVRPGLTSHVHG
jgi:hypothetical protein